MTEQVIEAVSGQSLWTELSLSVKDAMNGAKELRKTREISYEVLKQRKAAFWPTFQRVVTTAVGQIAAIPHLEFSHKVLAADEELDTLKLYAVSSMNEYKLLQLAHVPYPVAESKGPAYSWFCPSWLRTPKRWVTGTPIDCVLKSERVFPQLLLVFPFKFIWYPARQSNSTSGYLTPARYAPALYSRYRQLRGAKKTSAGTGLGFLENAGNTVTEQYSSLMEYVRRHYSAISLIERNKDLAWVAPTMEFDSMTQHMIKAFINVNIIKAREDAAKQRTLSGVG